MTEPVMAFPCAYRQFALIMDAVMGTADTPGELKAILTQFNRDRNFYTILFASRQLKDHEKSYSPFLLEAATAMWSMDSFNGYSDICAKRHLREATFARTTFARSEGERKVRLSQDRMSILSEGEKD